MASDTIDYAKTGGATVGPALLIVMREKIGRIGGIDILEDLKHIISDLKTCDYSLPEADKRIILNYLKNQPPFTQRL